VAFSLADKPRTISRTPASSAPVQPWFYEIKDKRSKPIQGAAAVRTGEGYVAYNTVVEKFFWDV
jgi:hypothetical protein